MREKDGGLSTFVMLETLRFIWSGMESPELLSAEEHDLYDCLMEN